MKMRLHEFTVVSKKDPAIALRADGDGMVADGVLGVVSFTMTAKAPTANKSHRFGLVLLADRDTMLNMRLSEEESQAVIGALTDKFRDLLYGVWGEEFTSLVIMEGIADMLGVPEPDGVQGENERSDPPPQPEIH
jgi:hypothetical protein